MDKHDKAKSTSLIQVSADEQLARMTKYREKFVSELGQETYNNLVKKLEDHIRYRKQPKSATPSSL
jgi:hypothetical protein